MFQVRRSIRSQILENYLPQEALSSYSASLYDSPSALMPALDHVPLNDGRASFPLLHQSLAHDITVSHLLQTSPRDLYSNLNFLTMDPWMLSLRQTNTSDIVSTNEIDVIPAHLRHHLGSI